MPTRTPGHPVEPSAVGRIVFGIVGFFVVPALMIWAGMKQAAFWVWRAPRVVQVILVVLVLGVLAGGVFAVIERLKSRAEVDIAVEWRKFETASRAAEEQELSAILDGILAKEPENREAVSRKRALETGEADPKDRPMVALMIRIHLKNNRQEDATREAKKMIALDPKDWISNCILGQDAIARKDEKDIEKYLAAIGDPAIGNVDLGGLLYSLELHRQSGKDATILRAFTVDKVIPNLKNKNLGTILPAGRVQILACYVDVCLSVPDSSVKNITEYWSWASQLADGILEDARAARNAQVLTQLGSIQPPLAGSIARFQKVGVLNVEEAGRQTRIVEDRARRIWKVAREIDPKNPTGYVGEAHALIKAGDLDAAHEMIFAGQTAHGSWSISLLTALTAWAKAARKTDEIWPELLKAANHNPNNVALWNLVAEATEASRRRDKAIDAIQKARAKAPENNWFTWVEARLWLEAGTSSKALELLKSIPDRDKLRHPAIIRAQVRAMTEAGEESGVDAFARAAMNAADKANEPDLGIAPALGLLDCPVTLERVRSAEKIAGITYGRWPTYLPALRTRARARLLLAEEDTENEKPRWAEVHVQEAIDDLTRLKVKDPTDIWTSAMLGWIRIKGGLNPELAASDIAQIVPTASDPAMTAEVLEAIGAVYLARNQFDDAIRVLTRARDTSRQPAGPLVALAVAHFKKGNEYEGRKALSAAGSLSQSARVREEYRDAIKKYPKE